MNPQYQPQPQFGDAPPQGFPSGRLNSNLSQPGLQDSFNMNNNPGPQPINNYMPPQQNFGYKGPNVERNSMQMPSTNAMGQPQPPPRQQLPPTSTLPPLSSPHMMPPGQMQNGLTTNQMAPPPQGMMGQGQMPPPPMGAMPAMDQSNSVPMGPPPTSGHMGPPGLPPTSTNSMGPPYLAVCPPHPSGMNPPPGQMGLPPTSMGSGPMPPSGPGEMRTSSGQMGPPPSQMPPSSGQMHPSSGQMHPSSGQMGPPSSQMHPPSGQMHPPSGQMGPPSGQMGPPSGQMHPPSNQMGPPPGQMGPPSGQMHPPSNQMGPSPGQMGSSPGQMGPPPGQMAPPPSQMAPPPQRSIGPPMTSVPSQINSSQMPPMNSGPSQMNSMSMGSSIPPGHSQMVTPTPLGAGQISSASMGPPPISGNNGPPRPGQMQMPPQMNNMPPTSMPSKHTPFIPPPNTAGPMGPPPFAGQNPPPIGGQNPPLLGGQNPPPLGAQNLPPIGGQNPPPPLGGQNAPRTNMAGMPPAPGQYSNKIGGPGAYPNILPPSNQSYNQLPNQMNNMHLNAGNRPYPGGAMKPAINGDNSMNAPHMPPPQMGQQYVNGSQNRSPQAQMPYPPMPGQQQQQQQQQQQMPSGPYPPQPQYQQQQQQQQARRLDPDQMPSPIQVTLDDQKTRSGIFCTNQKGLVPPLVSTNFSTQDQGNAGPRFIRSTMYNVPTTSDMMKQTAVPFGLVISPLARTIDQEYPPPIVDFGELGPVRCIRCKAYMCPFMQFIDSGRRFQCLFCKATTEVPAEYFQHLDHTGQRVDRYERPELILGAYEFVATKDYCRNNTYPKPPAIIFVIDVSYNNMKSGLVHLLCSEMKEILKHLPIDQGHEKSKMKVGFITYNSTVHFYNIKGTLAQPQMMVVGDTQEMFVPLLDGFLCDIEDSAAVIDSLMSQIPTMFTDTRDTEIVLLPAIQAGLEALKASECAGKLLVFHSTLPTAEAPGKLKNRDERKLLGTEKERTVLTPQNQAFNQLGQECVTAGCSVDLFITNNSYIDLATIGQISRLTGGEIFKYTYFQADIDGQRLVNDIITDISRPVAFDSIMRVRTSTGIRPTDFYGHFFMSNTTDMEIPAIDCDKAVAIEIKHDDKLTEEEGVYIQVALLYTSCSGQRRLRVLNLSLKTCSQMADLYRSCELDTIVNFFSKQCVYKILENNPKTVKDSLVNRCAQMLACYRKNCASPSSAGQLILPECMKLLPLYVNCLMKSDAISGGSDMTLDDRSFVMQCVVIMDIPTSVVYFYPRLIPLHEIQLGVENPDISSIRCTIEKMVDTGVYLLENGIHMLIWIGLNANPEWIQNVFGAPSAAQVDIDRISLPELDNSLNLSVRNVVDKIRGQRHRWMRLTLVRQRDKLETVFRHFLVEDRGQDGSTSYVDFLCHMHKEIRQLLS